MVDRGRHIWIQAQPPGTVAACGADLNYLLDIMPVTEVVTKVLTGSGECGKVDWRFLGLSMPWWVLISLAALGALGGAGELRRSQRARTVTAFQEIVPIATSPTAHHCRASSNSITRSYIADSVDHVGDAHALVHLVDGRVDDAELDDLRAGRRDEAAVGRAAGRRQLGLAAGLLVDRALHGRRQLAGRREERQAGDEPLERVVHLVAIEDLGDRLLQLLDRLLGREANVEARLEFARNDVRRAGAGADVRDLERRRLKVLVALVPARARPARRAPARRRAPDCRRGAGRRRGPARRAR